jgi:hypothetical protein
MEQGPQFGTIAHVAACEMHIGRKRLRIAGGEIIQPSHLMPFARKLVGKRRAEETRGSCNQEIHGFYYTGLSPILRDGILCKRTSAFEINADHFIHNKGKTSELKADLPVFEREYGIVCPGIHPEFSIRLIMAVRQPNAPGVEEE